MKKTAAIILAAALLLSLTACSALSLEENDLLSPPKSTGREERIRTIIEREAGPSYTLIYPVSGENKSAITFFDINNDGFDEALALYADPDESAATRLLFLRSVGDSFDIVSEFSMNTGSIDRVDLADIDGDGEKEILVGYPLFESSEGSLALFDFKNKVEVTTLSCRYDSLLTGDFTQSGSDDVLLLSLYSGKKVSSAALLSYDENSGMERISECELDSTVTDFISLSFGRISDSVSGAVIDSVSSSGEYTTQLVFYDGEKKALSNPLFVNASYADTRRLCPVLSKDADSDGIIEIPMCSKTDDSNACQLIQWQSYDNSDLKFVTKKTSFLCENDGYTFDISPSRDGAVTAVYDKENRALSVFDTKRKSGPLLKIVFYPRNIYSGEKSGETQLLDTASGVYAYSVTDTESSLSYTDEEIRESFSII